ncbi:LOB domain-containing protein 40-like [Wolffia australiana]
MKGGDTDGRNMRIVSCNGCRVLRKGCSERCVIRPCLNWINSAHSQAYATLFLAKFYGRAGLLNLVTAGEAHIRPAIFRSLLYEACGRIVNPVYGSVGLISSGRWQLCQEAVEAVLCGRRIACALADNSQNPRPRSAHKALCYDIRHVANRSKTSGKGRFKRSRKLVKGTLSNVATESSVLQSSVDEEENGHWRSQSRERVPGEENEENIDIASHALGDLATEDQREIELELTLGWRTIDSPFLETSSSGGS